MMVMVMVTMTVVRHLHKQGFPLSQPEDVTQGHHYDYLDHDCLDYDHLEYEDMIIIMTIMTMIIMNMILIMIILGVYWSWSLVKQTIKI